MTHYALIMLDRDIDTAVVFAFEDTQARDAFIHEVRDYVDVECVDVQSAADAANFLEYIKGGS